LFDWRAEALTTQEIVKCYKYYELNLELMWPMREILKLWGRWRGGESGEGVEVPKIFVMISIILLSSHALPL